MEAQSESRDRGTWNAGSADSTSLSRTFVGFRWPFGALLWGVQAPVRVELAPQEGELVSGFGVWLRQMGGLMTKLSLHVSHVKPFGAFGANAFDTYILTTGKLSTD